MALSLGMIKTFLLVSLLLLAPLSSGLVEGFDEGMNSYPSLHQDGGIQVNTRKLLLDELDYDETGPNRRHDPRGRPGVGGYKNP
ncbi:hypothetical protein NC652_028973 [Populus alba x Populus x berolinensis]|uniref:Uncharacterized protein n=1 Tax=Populus alba TaxID=43335 RepID=A0ACC4BA07_POPAL|nr:uncharacterized protein LOC118033115 [Populus alba]KAJ6887838.1 hypothetical protein NC652_028973 [Populus alba x Populus x berolinensis]